MTDEQTSEDGEAQIIEQTQTKTPVQELQEETQKLNQAIGIINAGKQLENNDLEEVSIQAFKDQLEKVNEVVEEKFE